MSHGNVVHQTLTSSTHTMQNRQEIREKESRTIRAKEERNIACGEGKGKHQLCHSASQTNLTDESDVSEYSERTKESIEPSPSLVRYSTSSANSRSTEGSTHDFSQTTASTTDDAVTLTAGTDYIDEENTSMGSDEGTEHQAPHFLGQTSLVSSYSNSTMKDTQSFTLPFTNTIYLVQVPPNNVNDANKGNNPSHSLNCLKIIDATKLSKTCKEETHLNAIGNSHDHYLLGFNENHPQYTKPETVETTPKKQLGLPSKGPVKPRACSSIRRIQEKLQQDITNKEATPKPFQPLRSLGRPVTVNTLTSSLAAMRRKRSRSRPSKYGSVSSNLVQRPYRRWLGVSTNIAADSRYIVTSRKRSRSRKASSSRDRGVRRISPSVSGQNNVSSDGNSGNNPFSVRDRYRNVRSSFGNGTQFNRDDPDENEYEDIDDNDSDDNAETQQVEEVSKVDNMFTVDQCIDPMSYNLNPKEQRPSISVHFDENKPADDPKDEFPHAVLMDHIEAISVSNATSSNGSAANENEQSNYWIDQCKDEKRSYGIRDQDDSDLIDLPSDNNEDSSSELERLLGDVEKELSIDEEICSDDKFNDMPSSHIVDKEEASDIVDKKKCGTFQNDDGDRMVFDGKEIKLTDVEGGICFDKKSCTDTSRLNGESGNLGNIEQEGHELSKQERTVSNLSKKQDDEISLDGESLSQGFESQGSGNSLLKEEIVKKESVSVSDIALDLDEGTETSQQDGSNIPMDTLNIYMIAGSSEMKEFDEVTEDCVIADTDEKRGLINQEQMIFCKRYLVTDASDAFQYGQGVTPDPMFIATSGDGGICNGGKSTHDGEQNWGEMKLEIYYDHNVESSSVGNTSQPSRIEKEEYNGDIKEACTEKLAALKIQSPSINENKLHGIDAFYVSENKGALNFGNKIEQTGGKSQDESDKKVECQKDLTYHAQLAIELNENDCFTSNGDIVASGNSVDHGSGMNESTIAPRQPKKKRRSRSKRRKSIVDDVGTQTDDTDDDRCPASDSDSSTDAHRECTDPALVAFQGGLAGDVVSVAEYQFMNPPSPRTCESEMRSACAKGNIRHIKDVPFDGTRGAHPLRRELRKYSELGLLPPAPKNGRPLDVTRMVRKGRGKHVEYYNVQAIRKFEGKLPGQLSFEKGQIIKQRDTGLEPKNGMCYGYYKAGKLRRKKFGLYPCTHVTYQIDSSM